MSIQGINFTSSLLDKKNVASVTEDSKVTTPQNLEEKPDEFVKETDETELQEKPNHKVRNWTIGIGSAAALVWLFFAGRAGKLGKGIQKFLGGAKKEVEEAAGHSKPRVTESEEEISIEEFERIKNKDTDFVVGGNKKPTGTSTEEIKTPKTEEKPKVEEKPAAKAEEPKPVTEAPKLTPKQVELNAKLDRVPPYIDPDFLHHDFPTPERLYKHLGIDMKEIEKIDISKYSEYIPSEIKYEMKLPNGNNLTIYRDSKGAQEICEIKVCNDGKTICTMNRYTDPSKSYYGGFNIRLYYENSNINYKYNKGNVKSSIDYVHQNGNRYTYNEEGTLKHFQEPENKNTGISRRIYVDNGKINDITYSEANHWLKYDNFDENGKITKETFNSELPW